jgi:hypothetical protein
MLVPKFLYGERKDVASGVKRAVTGLRHGWDPSLLDLEATVNTDSVQGAFLISPNRILSATGPCFYFFALFIEIAERDAVGKLPDTVLEGAFWWSLEEPWRFLGVLNSGASSFIGTHPRKVAWRQPLLSAALRFWDELEADQSRTGIRRAGRGEASAYFTISGGIGTWQRLGGLSHLRMLTQKSSTCWWATSAHSLS